MHLNCGQCTVRPWQESDLESLVHHADNREIWLRLRDLFPHPYTMADGVAWLNHVASLPTKTDFAIECDGQAVGGIGLILGKDIERFSAEIGYWLGQSYWGRGIATAALRGLADYAFQTHNLNRLFALPLADNLASRRVLEKAGFVLEGVLRRSAVKAGQVHDQAMYSRIR